MVEVAEFKSPAQSKRGDRESAIKLIRESRAASVDIADAHAAFLE